MKFKCKQGELAKGLGVVEKAVSSKSVVPILSNILMTAKEGKVTFTGTDMEVGIQNSISVEVGDEGSITVPAKRFYNIVKSLPTTDVSVEATDNRVTVKTEKIEFKINGLPFEEFPALPIPSETGFSIDGRVLKDLIQKTIFANSRDETRYILNGSYLEIEKDRIAMTATDGHRLATKCVDIESNIEPMSAVVPTKVLNILSGLIGDTEVTIVVSEKQVTFSLDGIILTSKLIEGTYPSYEEIIPTKNSKKITANKDRLLTAIKRVSIISDQRSGAVILTVRPKQLIVSAQTSQVGESRDEMEVEYGGEEVKISFNYSYLVDVLKNISTENIIIELEGPLSPTIIKPTNSEKYLCVLMPMRIS